MHDTGTLKRHASLFDNMANACGIDLEERVIAGDLSIPELDDALLRCADCPKPDACSVWIRSQAQQPMPTPSYCKNSELFAELKRV